MAVRSMNTFSEGLQKLLGDCSELKQLPDVDLPWVIELETAILSKLRKPIDDMMADAGTGLGGMSSMPDPNQPGASVPGLAGMMGAGGGVAPGGPPGAMGPGMGGPPGGLSTRAAGPMGMAPPNPDELRRVMSGSNVQGG